MNLKQLTYFVRVAEMGSFSKAAILLDASAQPTGSPAQDRSAHDIAATHRPRRCAHRCRNAPVRAQRRHSPAGDEKIDVSKVDVSMNGIERQDREFFAAVREGREPNASVAKVLPCYRTLHKLEQQLVAA